MFNRQEVPTCLVHFSHGCLIIISGIPSGISKGVEPKLLLLLLLLVQLLLLQLEAGGQAATALSAAAELLGVLAAGLERVLTTRTRQTPDGAITSPLNAQASSDNR